MGHGLGAGLLIGTAVVGGLLVAASPALADAGDDSGTSVTRVLETRLEPQRAKLSTSVRNKDRAILKFDGDCKKLRFGARSSKTTRWATGSSGVALNIRNQPRVKLLVRRSARSSQACAADVRILTSRNAKRTPKPRPPAPSPTPTSPTPTPSPSTPAPTPSATVTPAPEPTPSTTVPPAGTLSPMDFGAVGDGVADDTFAVQRALDALTPGSTLHFPAGKVFRHTGVVTVRRADVSLIGAGVMLATNEFASAFLVKADGVTVDGLTFRMASTTKRWVAYEQMKLRIGSVSGVTVRNVVIDGSAAAGLYVGGADDFTIQDVVVKNTRADGIHMTEASHDGRVVRPFVKNPGDDGVAVVSYLNDGAPCRNIEIVDPRLEGQKWGRGFSVVGGSNITYRNIYANGSAGAGLYISAESEFNTFGVSNVLVDGGTLVNSNQQAAITASQRPSPDQPRIVHGAVMLYNSQASQAISDVTVRNLTIKDTDPEGYDHVQILSYNNEQQSRIWLDGIHISGGSSYPIKTLGVPSSSLRKTGWVMNGLTLADSLGW